MRTLKSTLLTPILVMLVVSASGCGGSDDADAAPVDTSQPDGPTEISGGRASAPTSVDASARHVISSDRSTNYFKYQGFEGERVIIHAILNSPLDDADARRCSAAGDQPGSLATDIFVFDEQFNELGGTCTEILQFKLPADGTYIFQPDYAGRNGYFLAAVVAEGQLRVGSRDGSGAPDDPIGLFDQSKTISSNPFFNHYSINISEGAKLRFEAILSPPLSDVDRRRCSASPSSTTYRTAIEVYSESYELLGARCGDTFEFVVPATATYVFNMNFYHGRSGHYDVTVID